MGSSSAYFKIRCADCDLIGSLKLRESDCRWSPNWEEWQPHHGFVGGGASIYGGSLSLEEVLRQMKPTCIFCGGPGVADLTLEDTVG